MRQKILMVIYVPPTRVNLFLHPQFGLKLDFKRTFLSLFYYLFCSRFLHRINLLFHKEIVKDPVYYAIDNDKNGHHNGLIISGHRASHDCFLFVL